ncbi:calpain-2 catalytic subunit-like, partial [Oncorhynchus masou masou]|uniref:calpain-2 catalytic subunit-like n=1 Tax=Oncorhynchus masou masou TaxID=90313 RepID=UPI003183CA03
VNGCYEALSGGSTTEGFEDFTGGIAEVHELRNAGPKLFKIIRKALSRGSLLGCSIDISNLADSEAITSSKLVRGHAYSLTGAELVSYRGDSLQLVSNPWGQVEWTGAWSDGATEWCSGLRHCISVLAMSLQTPWMSFSDFLSQYSRLEICNLTPDTLSEDENQNWALNKFEGAWRKGSTAGEWTVPKELLLVITKPCITKPRITKPRITKPRITKPRITKPRITKPRITKPRITKPRITKPRITKPRITKPRITKPRITKPRITKPRITKPCITKPCITKPCITKPRITKPCITKPRITKPVSPSPVSPKLQ